LLTFCERNVLMRTVKTRKCNYKYIEKMDKLWYNNMKDINICCAMCNWS
jgi:hypothetical protein